MGMKTRTRDPEATRECLLHCAFEEIYEHGYGGASLDRILSKSGVTKGALYHHFGSKAELALAVIDEVIEPWVLERWSEPLQDTEDPVSAIRDNLRSVVGNMSERELACGCPLNNLSQELSATDEAFRTRLESAFAAWRGAISGALARGQRAGTVRLDIDPDAAATFIVSSFEGLASTMKSSRDLTLASSGMTVFLELLEGLRTAPVDSAA